VNLIWTGRLRRPRPAGASPSPDPALRKGSFQNPFSFANAGASRAGGRCKIDENPNGHRLLPLAQFGYQHAHQGPIIVDVDRTEEAGPPTKRRQGPAPLRVGVGEELPDRLTIRPKLAEQRRRAEPKALPPLITPAPIPTG